MQYIIINFPVSIYTVNTNEMGIDEKEVYKVENGKIYHRHLWDRHSLTGEISDETAFSRHCSCDTSNVVVHVQGSKI